MPFLKKAHQNTPCYQILSFYLKKHQSYKGGEGGGGGIYRNIYYIIKIMPCVEGDRSDCQPEASSIAGSRRLRAMVVVKG